ncbi:hypothetical protein STSP_22150 [Streptomyces jeddahensis]|uniref:Uncharacterized protein n=1 Tax=Streptomyces jeddahensis TaxID=1716141 RepID=A0A177HUN9_9ACTN|nr:hypothetical protein STSP_22150 [Streptomyces jeddahensis]
MRNSRVSPPTALRPWAGVAASKPTTESDSREACHRAMLPMLPRPMTASCASMRAGSFSLLVKSGESAAESGQQ